jgi:hypothetical protein
MIKREKIDELLNLPVDEHRQVLRLLQESLPAQGANGFRREPRNDRIDSGNSPL